MPTSFDLDDLRRTMRESVGVDEHIDLDADIADTLFSELGYDSLAVLEVTARIGRDLGFSIPDEEAAELVSPQAVVDYVNRRLAPEGEVRVENAVVIDAPLDFVWRMTNDVTIWPELFSDCTKSEILEQDDKRVLVRLYTEPDENGHTPSFESVRVHDRPNLVVEGQRLTPGPAFAYLRIRWDFAEVEDGVRMRWVQRFQLRPDAPLDNAGMVEKMTRYTRGQMSRIKGIVEQAAATELAAKK